jgi:hypothetical protein
MNRYLTLGLLMLPATVGCAREPKGPALNPDQVVTVQQLTGPIGMTVTVFAYNDPDERGWPSDPTHRRFVRFLQDNGVTVAFLHDEPSGLWYVHVRARDAVAVGRLKQDAAKQGVPVPSITPTGA